MARLAGDSNSYTLALLNAEGQPTEHTFDLPSVTTVLKMFAKGDGLIGWAYNTAIEGMRTLAAHYQLEAMDPDEIKALLKKEGYTPWVKRDKAAQRGSNAHDYAEALARKNEKWANSIEDETPEDEKGFLEAARSWFEAKNPSPIEIEAPLVSLDHRFAGTVDLIWFDHDETYDNGIPVCTLTDYKTSKSIFDGHLIQVAAYKLAAEEMGYGPIDRLTVVRFGEDGKWDEKESHFNPSVFLNLLEIYRAVKGE